MKKKQKNLVPAPGVRPLCVDHHHGRPVGELALAQDVVAQRGDQAPVLGDRQLVQHFPKQLSFF
jgi:hypothetical protein